jgi:hypothetical protein
VLCHKYILYLYLYLYLRAAEGRDLIVATMSEDTERDLFAEARRAPMAHVAPLPARERAALLGLM